MDDPRASPNAANPAANSAPAAPTTSSGENGGLPLRPGHELPFVASSSYLRPKPPSRTMSERSPSGLDKDQMQGLVSLPLPRQPPWPLARFSLGRSHHKTAMRGSGPLAKS
jgi:hypothetical protein